MLAMMLMMLMMLPLSVDSPLVERPSAVVGIGTQTAARGHAERVGSGTLATAASAAGRTVRHSLVLLLKFKTRCGTGGNYEARTVPPSGLWHFQWGGAWADAARALYTVGLPQGPAVLLMLIVVRGCVRLSVFPPDHRCADSLLSACRRRPAWAVHSAGSCWPGRKQNYGADRSQREGSA
jgi:hypothetical protein